MWNQEWLDGKARANLEIVNNEAVLTVRAQIVDIVDAITDKIPGQLDDMALDTMTQLVVSRFSKSEPTTSA